MSDETALDLVVGRESEISDPVHNPCLNAEVTFLHSWHRSENTARQLHTSDVSHHIESADPQAQ